MFRQLLREFFWGSHPEFFCEFKWIEFSKKTLRGFLQKWLRNSSGVFCRDFFVNASRQAPKNSSLKKSRILVKKSPGIPVGMPSGFLLRILSEISSGILEIPPRLTSKYLPRITSRNLTKNRPGIL